MRSRSPVGAVSSEGSEKTSMLEELKVASTWAGFDSAFTHRPQCLARLACLDPNLLYPIQHRKSPARNLDTGI